MNRRSSTHTVFAVYAGTDGQTWILAFPFNNWAEYGASFNMSFWKMVEEVCGDFETDMLRRLWSKSVSGQRSFILAYRQDLSNNPAR